MPVDKRAEIIHAKPNGIAKRPDGRPSLGETVAGQVGRAVERAEHVRRHALLRRHRPGRLQLQRQAGQAVRQHVVHVTGDPTALPQRRRLRFGVPADLQFGEERLGPVPLPQRPRGAERRVGQ